jgi:PTS system ascorbate-specific IIB component
MAEPLKVVTVCGVGMGSSLILKMTAEAAFRDLGIAVRVENTDLPGLRGMRPDVVLAQPLHASEIGAAAPVVVEVTDFLDKDKLRAALEPRLREAGFLK